MNNRWMASTAILIATIVPGKLFAQSAPQPPSSETPISASAPASGLQDITVTAQRRSENLQRAAIAVSAVTGDGLVRAGVTDTTQLSSVVPALQVGNVVGPYNSFYLRGVGNFTTNALSDSAVAFGVDGVPFARTSSAGGSFYDLDRVEVLKGPQGTLYGRNATGGAINVITTKPVFGQWSGYGTFEYGNYDTKKFTGALNAPLGADSALRISTQIVDRDGYLSDGTSDEKSQAVRAIFATKPLSGVRITVDADYYHQGGKGGGATVTGLNLNDRIGLSDPRAQAIYSTALAFGAGNFLVPVPDDSYQNNTFYGMYLQAEVDTPVGKLTVLPSYRHSSLDFLTYSGGSAGLQMEKDKQASVEIRLASTGTGPLSYLIGGYYLHDATNAIANYNQEYFAAFVGFKPVTDSYATFGRLTYALTDHLRLTAGARYTADHKRADLSDTNLIVVCPGSSVPPPAGPQFCVGGPQIPLQLTVPSVAFAPNGSLIPVQPYGSAGNILIADAVNNSPRKIFSKVTYRGAIEADIGPRSLIYASIETGFKSGGFFSSVDASSYAPETITAYTIGSKNRFFDNRLQLNLEAFYWKYKNQQFSHFRTNSLGGTEFVTENIGSSTIKGVELETQFLATPTTLISGNVQYLDARNDSFVYSNPAAAGPPATGCPVTFNAETSTYLVNCGGFRPPQAPELTISAGIEQTIPLGEHGKFVFDAHARYQSRTLTGQDFLAGEYQRGYWIGDLQLAWTAPGDHFTVATFVNNVANKAAIGNSQVLGQTPQLIAYSLRPPRTYGVRVGYKF